MTMKKIVVIFLLFLLLAGFGQENEVDSHCEIDNGWNYVSLNKKLDNSDLIMAKFVSNDGQIGFCMEPTVRFLDCSEYSSENYHQDKIVEVAKVIKAYEELGGSDNLYIAAQLMIWDIIGQRQSIDGDIGYRYGRSEIENYINNNFKSHHPELPNELEIELGKEYEIVDTKGLLEGGYEINGNNFSTLSKDKNTIHFKVDQIYPVIKTIDVHPKESIKNILANQAILFRSDNSQNILRLNGSFPMIYEGTKIKVKHKTGDLIVNKKDAWGDSIKEEISFHLYMTEKSEDEYLLKDEILTEDGKLWTTEDGILEIKDILPPGYYYLKEAKSDSYLLDETLILFEIAENKLTSFNFYNENRDVKIEIKKTNEGGEALHGAKFSIYDISDNLDVDKENTILNTGIEDIIKSENNNEQVHGEDFYQKENIYLLKRGKEVNINDFLLDDINYDGPIDMVLCHKSLIDLKDNTLIANSNGYSDYVIYEGQYPELYLKYILGNFKIYDKEENDISDNFVIEKREGEYYFIAKNLAYKLEFFIKNDDCNKYLDKRRFDFPKLDRKLLKEGRIYVMDNLDLDYARYDALKIYESETFKDMIQIYNPSNHNLYLPNYPIDIYKKDTDELYKSLISDERGNISLEDFIEGEYYYEVEDNNIYFTYPLKEDVLSYNGLKYGRKYLVCEIEPADGFEYIDDPCIFVNTDDAHKTYELNFINKIRNIDLIIYKANSNKNILLDNALFEITFKPYLLQDHLKLDEGLKTYKKKYISGGLVIENKDEYRYLYIKNDNDEIAKYNLDKELILDNLDEGIYYLYFSNEELDDFENIDWISKEVIKGGFKIEDLRYDYLLNIKELKAPSGYIKEEEEFTIKPELAYGLVEIENYRINQAIIIPNTGCLKRY